MCSLGSVALQRDLAGHTPKKSFDILKLSLQLLQRDDLRWRCRRNREHLPKQRGTTDHSQSQDIPPNRRFNDRVPHIAAPAGRVTLELHRAGVGAKLHEAQGCVMRG